MRYLIIVYEDGSDRVLRVPPSFNELIKEVDKGVFQFNIPRSQLPLVDGCDKGVFNQWLRKYILDESTFVASRLLLWCMRNGMKCNYILPKKDSKNPAVFFSTYFHQDIYEIGYCMHKEMINIESREKKLLRKVAGHTYQFYGLCKQNGWDRKELLDAFEGEPSIPFVKK